MSCSEVCSECTKRCYQNCLRNCALWCCGGCIMTTIFLIIGIFTIWIGSYKGRGTIFWIGAGFLIATAILLVIFIIGCIVYGCLNSADYNRKKCELRPPDAIHNDYPGPPIVMSDVIIHVGIADDFLPPTEGT